MTDDLPAAPVLRVTSTDNGVEVSWDHVAGVDSYQGRVEGPDGRQIPITPRHTFFIFELDGSARVAGAYQRLTDWHTRLPQDPAGGAS